jgi:hypothetical protein
MDYYAHRSESGRQSEACVTGVRGVPGTKLVNLRGRTGGGALLGNAPRGRATVVNRGLRRVKWANSLILS